MTTKFDNLLTEFPQKIQKIQENQKNVPQEKTLHTLALHAYYEHILSKLNAFSTPSREALVAFLKENWDLIRGTNLCYTALPEDRITLLMCDIAMALEDEQRGALNLLMPDVVTQSMDEEKYPHLGAYTVTTISEDSLSVEEQNKVAPINVRETLKTHILGRSGTYLVPVHYLLELDDPTKPIPNMYFDDAKHDAEEWCLHEEELQRLFKHSALTSDLKQNFAVYLDRADNQASFLKQIRSLQQCFYVSGAHGGIGTQENAASVAFPKIIEFINYYRQLKPTTLKQIPDDLLKEIDFLIELCSDINKNAPNGQTSLDTCLGTRSEVLGGLINRYEVLLSGIETDKPTQEDLGVCKEDIARNKNKLVLQLRESSYQGLDCFGLNARLFKELSVDFVIDSYESLAELMTLEAGEISDLLNAPNLDVRNQVLNQLDDINPIFSFFCDITNQDKLRVVFSSLCMELYHNNLLDVPRVLHLIELLGPTLGSVVCDILIYQLSESIDSAEELGDVLEQLKPEQIKALCECMINKFPEIIPAPKALSLVLNGLSYEQCFVACQVLKPHLCTLIDTAERFCTLMRRLGGQRCTAVFEVMTDHLLTLLRVAADFYVTFREVSDEQSDWILQATKDRLPSVIRLATDYTMVVQWLPDTQYSVVYQAMKNHIPQLINSIDDFCTILRWLNEGEIQELCSMMQDKLLALFQAESSDGFYRKITPMLDSERIMALKIGLPFLNKELPGPLWARSTSAVTEPNDYVFFRQKNNKTPVNMTFLDDLSISSISGSLRHDITSASDDEDYLFDAYEPF